MGPNRCGKTTILHALACSFLPENLDEGYTFPYFFRTNSDTKWSGSEYTIWYSFKNGELDNDNKTKTFKKLKDRWGPRNYRNDRPIRNVIYIDILDSVPVLEIECGKTGVLRYKRHSLRGPNIEWIKRMASDILNVDYHTYDRCTYTKRQAKDIYGVEVDSIKYSAVSMSAGEQRIFRILESVANAQRYSLILIDEMSLFLHEYALKRLIKILNNKANVNKLQIIFTSHFPGIANMYTNINVRHLYKDSKKTICLDGYHPDAIYRLTGRQYKPYELYCEDDVSSKIIEHIAVKAGIKRNIEIICFGSASNCFTIASAMSLKNENNNKIYVLDGDCYQTDEEKTTQINKLLSGDGECDKERRAEVKEIIIEYNSGGLCPEEKLCRMVKEIRKEVVDINDVEYYQVVNEVNNIDNHHEIISIMIDRMGIERSTAIEKLVSMASKSDGWNDYVRPVRDWILEKKRELEQQQEGVPDA